MSDFYGYDGSSDTCSQDWREGQPSVHENDHGDVVDMDCDECVEEWEELQGVKA